MPKNARKLVLHRCEEIEQRLMLGAFEEWLCGLGFRRAPLTCEWELLRMVLGGGNHREVLVIYRNKAEDAVLTGNAYSRFKEWRMEA